MTTPSTTRQPDPPLRLRASEVVTHGLRAKAEPFFMAEHSVCDEGHYLFGYRITLTNELDQAAQLCSRHWIIVDAEGERKEVHGHGVVGETPRLAPGASFQYVSFCPLPTSWGTMEGSMLFELADGCLVEAAVGRFYLVASPEVAR